MAALEEIMQLARRKAAASAATDTSNNTGDDDDIISPRIREFFDRLEKNNLEVVEVDEEELRITVQLDDETKKKEKDPDIANMYVIARIIDNDIFYSYTYACNIYDLFDGLMADGKVRSMAKIAEIHKNHINHAFETIREFTREHERTKEHDDYIR